MSDRIGDMELELIMAENNVVTMEPLQISTLFRDARYLIHDLDQERASACNRADDLQREGGMSESLRRIATALEAIARKHGREAY